jgi:hypothetical protein
MDWWWGIFLIALASAFTLAIIVILIAFGKKYAAKFDKIIVGMTYEEVKKIVGEPKDENWSENIRTCVWKRYATRDWTQVYTVTFRDDKVISVIKG